MSNQLRLEADVVIVGSGLAGAFLSFELAQKGYKVICLEAGPEIERYKILQNFKGQIDRDFQVPYASSPHAPNPTGKGDDPYVESVGANDYNVSYLRGVGGTTWHWAGHTWRFLKEDFKEYSTYGIGRDMPMTYEELEPFYEKAEYLMGVSGVSDPLNYYGVKRENPYPMSPLPLSYIDSYIHSKIESLGLSVKSAPSARNSQVYDQRPLCCGSNNCMPICPIGAQYSASVHLEKARQFPNMQLISSAVVDKIVTTDHKKVDCIRFRDIEGNEHEARATHYVLAGGGIEIPKLLLFSEVGNDNVGRNLMDHPLMFVSFKTKEDVFPGRGPMVVGSIIEHQIGDFRSLRSGFRINLKNFIFMQSIANEYIEKGFVGKNLKDKIDDHAKRLVGMELFFGQQPNRNNRVMLSSNRKDSLGIPHPRINYSVGAWTEKAVTPAYDVCQSIAQACNLESGSLQFNSENAGLKKRFNANNHIMGTTVMGFDSKNSVTDRIGRVYSKINDEPMINLFIASSGLLGATGVSNVSLTIAALSLRLAKHLNEELENKR